MGKKREAEEREGKKDTDLPATTLYRSETHFSPGGKCSQQRERSSRSSDRSADLKGHLAGHQSADWSLGSRALCVLPGSHRCWERHSGSTNSCCPRAGSGGPATAAGLRGKTKSRNWSKWSMICLSTVKPSKDAQVPNSSITSCGWGLCPRRGDRVLGLLTLPQSQKPFALIL